MVYGSGIGVYCSGPRLGVDDWTTTLPLAALDGRPERVEVAGVGAVLYRDGSDVMAVGERCPHMGAPMTDGWIDRGRIVCPWHGSRFACETGAGPARSGYRATTALPDAGPRWIRRGSRSGSDRNRRGRDGEMNAYDVLFEHHEVLRGHCKKISEIPAETDERRDALGELLVELDIHMRIEDSTCSIRQCQRPAHSSPSRTQSIVRCGTSSPSSCAPPHGSGLRRRVARLRHRPLDAHASEEERDLCPPPIELTSDMLEALGDEMLTRMEQLRASSIEKLHVRSRGAILRGF